MTPDPRRWWALAVLCLALCMVVLDNTIMAVAVPSIAAELGATRADLEWITTAYGLVLAGLLLPLAVMGDRWGRRRLLLLGLAIFGVASAAASAAGSPGALIACRGLMGLGGACTMPATLSLLGNLFPEDERARAVAIWSGLAGAAAAAGPIVSGVLLSRFWWGSVLLVNVPVAVATFVAAVVLVPESRDRDALPIDRASAWRWWAALSLALVALIEGPTHGWLSPLVVGSAGGAGVLFVAFVRQEGRSPAPLVGWATAREPRFRVGAGCMAALFACQFGSQFVLTQWYQGPRGLGPLATGCCFLPAGAAALLGSACNPRLVAGRGHGFASVAGLAGVAAGAAMAAIGVGADVLVVAVSGFALVGAGIGLASPSAVELQLAAVPPERAGTAAGVNETVVEAAGAVGVAAMGTVLISSGGHTWPLVLAAAAVAATALSLLPASRRSPAPLPS